MKYAHQLSAKQFYNRPYFYKQIMKVLGRRKYEKYRDYTGMVKQIATKLEAIHIKEDEWKIMRARAYKDIEAYLIRRFPKEKITIQCSTINLFHPKAHKLLCVLAKNKNFKGAI